MPAEENLALVRRFLEARVKADLSAIEEMMSRPTARPRGLQAPSCRVRHRLLRRPLRYRGPGSRRRQGGEPHQRPRYPRSQGAYGHRAHRQ
jgi:hypothetical protein